MSQYQWRYNLKSTIDKAEAYGGLNDLPQEEAGRSDGLRIKGIIFIPHEDVTHFSCEQAEILEYRLGLPSPGMKQWVPDNEQALHSRFEVTLNAVPETQKRLQLKAVCESGRHIPLAELWAFPHLVNQDDPYWSHVECQGQTFLFWVRDTHDEIQARHHGRGRFYEEHILSAVTARLRPGATLIDAGTNVGNHAIYWSNIGRAQHVYVFEPNPSAQDVLFRNVARNNAHTIRFDFVDCAVGAASTHGSILPGDTERNLGGAKITSDDEGSVVVAALDDLFPKLDVLDLIKIDVEGMEIDVLKGAEKLIQRTQPMICIEITKETQAAFQSWCRDQGYTVIDRFSMYKDIYTCLAVPG